MPKAKTDYKRFLDWKNTQRAYWRDMHRVFTTHPLDEGENSERMNKGLAPRKWVVLRSKVDGHLFEKKVTVELHHVTGMLGDKRQEDYCLVECWPWEHAMMDNSRHINYEFVRWGRLV